MSVALLFQALAERSQNSPDSPVLVGSQQTWHAPALMAAIDELAMHLAGCRTLAVLADNSPAWVMADLAALRAGVVHVPLPTFFNPAQMGHVLDQTGADTVLTDQPERIEALNAGFSITGQANGLIRMQRPLRNIALPAGTAKVSFTSGSTGAPKGACLSAAGLIDTALAVSRRLADLPIERHLAALPLSLLLENSAGIYAPLLRGAEIHLPSLPSLGWKGMAGFDPGALQQLANSVRPSSMILVPELLKAWSMYLAATGQQAPASLSYVAVGGARVDPASIGKARALGLPAYQGYGLTECGSVVSLNCPGDDSDDVGRPLDHVAVRVVDDEIRISARAFLGYIGDAAQTETGSSVERREFASGDLGHVDDNGHLHLSGRRKNLLITSFGRNIAPEWVEACLLAQPAIAQAVVTGDARPWLSAVLVPAAGVGPGTLAEAVAQANTTLPDYARIGNWLCSAPFTLQNGLATGNGRPVRAAILAQHAAELAALYTETITETTSKSISESVTEKEPEHVVL